MKKDVLGRKIMILILERLNLQQKREQAME
jgi:hypothetical protein